MFSVDPSSSVTPRNAPTIRDQLIALGDPSGQQNCTYWNEWFATVCYNNNSTLSSCSTSSVSESFEWYCSADTVSEILTQYILVSSSPSPPSSDPCTTTIHFFHPGNGNSHLPFYLKENIYKNSHHVIMDISDLAVTHMIRIMCSKTSTQQLQQDQDQEKIEMDSSAFQFMIGNVLDQELSSSSSSSSYSSLQNIQTHTFDAWIDKGLIDALFSGKDVTSDLQQCQKLMTEANRILTRGGYAFIVTMAQTHVLVLILQTWLQQQDQHQFLWKPHLHIHEVDPSSGTQRPFIFILQQDDHHNYNDDHYHHHENDSTMTLWRITFHFKNHLQDNQTILFHYHTFNTHTTTINTTTNHTSSPSFCKTTSLKIDEILPQLEQLLDISRQVFISSLSQEKEGQQQQDDDMDDCYKVLTKLEIKLKHPMNTTELTLLHDFIIQYPWNHHHHRNHDRNISSLSWYPLEQLQPESIDITSTRKIERIFKYGYVENIGYGIRKLVLICIISTQDLDVLCHEIQHTIRKDHIIQREKDNHNKFYSNVDDIHGTVTDNNNNDDDDTNTDDVDGTNNDHGNNISMDNEDDDDSNNTGDDIEDEDEDTIIQSIDIDWDSTVPISNAKDLLSSLINKS